MSKAVLIYIEHIVSSIEDILDYTKQMNEKEFLEQKMVQDAVVRKLEIIGEAEKNIPSSFREEFPHLPWKKMAGMRDKLIHNYISVDNKLIWAVVEDLLPDLYIEIKKIKDYPAKPQG
jgi:uncharacterized protein with HEPN domain